MNSTLLILAAGLGSRFGRLKQLEPLGQKNKTLIDYSINDAIKAGFTSIVFVIQKSFFKEFRNSIGNKYSNIINIKYAFQENDDFPKAKEFNFKREKPWGTAHAIWSARNSIQGPFAVINADDFYGESSFKQANEFCKIVLNNKGHVQLAGLICYKLENTLSTFGPVNRGICKINDNRYLEYLEEYTEIQLDRNYKIRGINKQRESITINPQTPVSMNFWIFNTNIFKHLESYLYSFLLKNFNSESKECYLPDFVDSLIQNKKLICKSYVTDSKWLGLTYNKDKEDIISALSEFDKAEKNSN